MERKLNTIELEHSAGAQQVIVKGKKGSPEI